MAGPAAMYSGTRRRMSELARGLDDTGANSRVPACPDWTVKDVYAHVAGICHDILAGNLEGVATDPWTAVHVESRRDNSLAQVLDEWDEKGAQVEAIMSAFPEFAARQLSFDCVTHEHDIRCALDRPGSRDSDAVYDGVDFVLNGLGLSLREHGLPALRVKAGDREWTLGDGEPAAGVAADPYELMRALTGRRSADQIRAFDWQGDSERYIGAFQFGPFTTREAALVE